MKSEEICEEFDTDSTDALVEEYKMKSKNRADDIIAVQAVVCILLTLLFIVGSIFSPALTGEIFEEVRKLASDSSELIPNPIDIILENFDKL